MLGNTYFVDKVDWDTDDWVREIKAFIHITSSMVKHWFTWMENITLWLKQNCPGYGQSHDCSMLNSKGNSKIASGIFKCHFKMSCWHLSNHPVDCASAFTKLILAGKDTSHFISVHVQRQLRVFNAFASSFIWDLQNPFEILIGTSWLDVRPGLELSCQSEVKQDSTLATFWIA